MKSPSVIQASLQMFTPFTDVSFINDCLLPRMLHVSHSLLQFADIFPDFVVIGFRSELTVLLHNNLEMISNDSVLFLLCDSDTNFGCL